MIAPDLAERGDAIRAAVDQGAALLAVCGGYQLLGRGYRGRDGSWMPGAALFPHETVAGDVRMIGDVLLESALPEAPNQTIAGVREPCREDAARRRRRALGRVVAGYGNDGESGYEGARVGRAIGTYLHGPFCRETRGSPTCCCRGRSPTRRGPSHVPLDPLEDELEREAHAVAAARARSRGGRPA